MAGFLPAVRPPETKVLSLTRTSLDGLRQRKETVPSLADRSSNPDQDDSAVMERVCDDDEAALDCLIHRYWSPLIRYSLGFVGSTDAAEDIAQSAFVRLWETRKRWVRSGSVRGFLYTTARNLCLNERNHRRVRQKWGEIQERIQHRNPTPLEILQQRELLQAIRETIDALPERRREVFILACLHGLSHQEVAGTMGIATPTVANQMTAALETLRRAIDRVSDEQI